MALDGKAIKEEIPDKEVYDSGSVRRAKGESNTLINERGQFHVGTTFWSPNLKLISRTLDVADDHFPTKPTIYGH